MGRSSLVDLPEELVSAIATHLSDRVDILHLALGSKQLNRIATEHLYREVKIVRRNKTRELKWYRKQIRALATRLEENPSLARCVKILVVRWQWNMLVEFDVTNVSAIVELFLHILPNLERLDYFPHGDSRLGICRAPLRTQPSSQGAKPLQRVKELLLGSRYGYQHENSFKPDCYMPYFGLPNLKKVLLFGIALRSSPYDFGDPGIEKFKAHMEIIEQFRDTHNLSVEHVEIRKCNFDWAAVCQIIGHCRALHTYIHMVLGFRDTYIPYELKALELHQKSLKNLQLSYVGNLGGFIDDPSHGLNFSPLECLEYLRITWCELIGTPDTAGRIWDDEEEYTAVIRRLPSRLAHLALVIPFINEASKDEIRLFHYVLKRMMQEKNTDWKTLIHIDVFVEDEYPTQGLQMDGLFQASKQFGVEFRVYHGNGIHRELGWGIDGNDHWEAMLDHDNWRGGYNEIISL